MPDPMPDPNNDQNQQKQNSDPWSDPNYVRQQVDTTADQYGVPRDYAHAIISQESGYRPYVWGAPTRHGRAYRLGQLMSGTADRYNVNRYDPAENLNGSMQHLSYLLKKYNGDSDLASAAYYQGEGAVDKTGGVPTASKQYVSDIRSRRGQGQNLTTTTPRMTPNGGESQSSAYSYDPDEYMNKLQQGLSSFQQYQQKQQEETGGEPSDADTQIANLREQYKTLRSSFNPPQPQTQTQQPEAQQPTTQYQKAPYKKLFTGSLNVQPSNDIVDDLQKKIAFSKSQGNQNVGNLTNQLDLARQIKTVSQQLARSKAQGGQDVDDLQGQLNALTARQSAVSNGGVFHTPVSDWLNQQGTQIARPSTQKTSFQGTMSNRLPLLKKPTSKPTLDQQIQSISGLTTLTSYGGGGIQPFTGTNTEQAPYGRNAFPSKFVQTPSIEEATASLQAQQALRDKMISSLSPEDMVDAEKKYGMGPADEWSSPAQFYNNQGDPEGHARRSIAQDLVQAQFSPNVYNDKEKAQMLYMADKVGVTAQDIQDATPAQHAWYQPSASSILGIAMRAPSKMPRALLESVTSLAPNARQAISGYLKSQLSPGAQQLAAQTPVFNQAINPPTGSEYQQLIQSPAFQSLSNRLKGWEAGAVKATPAFFDPQAPGLVNEVIGNAIPFIGASMLTGGATEALAPELLGAGLPEATEGAAALRAAQIASKTADIASGVSRATNAVMGVGMSNAPDVADQIDAQGATSPDYWQRRQQGVGAAAGVGAILGEIGYAGKAAQRLTGGLLRGTEESAIGNTIKRIFDIAGNETTGKAEQSAIIQALGRIGKLTNNAANITAPLAESLGGVAEATGVQTLAEGMNAYNEANIAKTDPTAFDRARLIPRLERAAAMGALGGGLFEGKRILGGALESVNRLNEAQSVKLRNDFIENGLQGQTFDEFLAGKNAGMSNARQANIQQRIGEWQQGAKTIDGLTNRISQIESGEQGTITPEKTAELEDLRTTLGVAEEKYGARDSEGIQYGRKLNERGVPMQVRPKVTPTVKITPEPGEVRGAEETTGQAPVNVEGTPPVTEATPTEEGNAPAPEQLPTRKLAIDTVANAVEDHFKNNPSAVSEQELYKRILPKLRQEGISAKDSRYYFQGLREGLQRYPGYEKGVLQHDKDGNVIGISRGAQTTPPSTAPTPEQAQQAAAPTATQQPPSVWQRISSLIKGKGKEAPTETKKGAPATTTPPPGSIKEQLARLKELASPENQKHEAAMTQLREKAQEYRDKAHQAMMEGNSQAKEFEEQGKSIAANRARTKATAEAIGHLNDQVANLRKLRTEIIKGKYTTDDTAGVLKQINRIQKTIARLKGNTPIASEPTETEAFRAKRGKDEVDATRALDEAKRFLDKGVGHHDDGDAAERDKAFISLKKLVNTAENKLTPHKYHEMDVAALQDVGDTVDQVRKAQRDLNTLKGNEESKPEDIQNAKAKVDDLVNKLRDSLPLKSTKWEQAAREGKQPTPEATSEIPAEKAAPKTAPTAEAPTASEETKVRPQKATEQEETTSVTEKEEKLQTKGMIPQEGWLSGNERYVKAFGGTARKEKAGNSSEFTPRANLEENLSTLNEIHDENIRRGNQGTPFDVFLKQRIAETEDVINLKNQGKERPDNKRYLSDNESWALRANPFNMRQVKPRDIPGQLGFLKKLKNKIESGRIQVKHSQLSDMVDRQIGWSEHANELWDNGKGKDAYNKAKEEYGNRARQEAAPSEATAEEPEVNKEVAAPTATTEQEQVSEKPIPKKQIGTRPQDDLASFILDKPGTRLLRDEIDKQGKTLGLNDKQIQDVVDGLQKGNERGQVSLGTQENGKDYVQVERQGEKTTAPEEGATEETTTTSPANRELTLGEKKKDIVARVNEYLADKPTGVRRNTLRNEIMKQMGDQKLGGLINRVIEDHIGNQIFKESDDGRISLSSQEPTEPQGISKGLQDAQPSTVSDSQKITAAKPEEKDQILSEVTDKWNKTLPDFDPKSNSKGDWVSNFRFISDESNSKTPVIYLNDHALGLLDYIYNRDLTPEQFANRVPRVQGKLINDLENVRDNLDEWRQYASGKGVNVDHIQDFTNYLDSLSKNNIDNAVALRSNLDPATRQQNIDHEMLHAWQMGILRERGHLLPEGFWDNGQNQEAKNIIRDVLMKPENYGRATHPDILNLEAATHVAQGTFERHGLTPDMAANFLDEYFKSIAESHPDGYKYIEDLADIAQAAPPAKESAARIKGELNAGKTEAETGRGRGTETNPLPTAESITPNNEPGGGRSDETEPLSGLVDKGTEERIKESLPPFKYTQTDNINTSSAVSNSTPADIYQYFGHEEDSPFSNKSRLSRLLNEGVDAVEKATTETRHLPDTLPGARAQWVLQKLADNRLTGPFTNKVQERIADIEGKQEQVIKDVVGNLTNAANAFMTAHDAIQKGGRDMDAEDAYEAARKELVKGFSQIHEYTKGGEYITRFARAAILSSPAVPLWNMMKQFFQMPFHVAQNAMDWSVPRSWMQWAKLNDLKMSDDSLQLDHLKMRQTIRNGFDALGSMGKGTATELRQLFTDGFTKQMAAIHEANVGLGVNRARLTSELYEYQNQPRLVPGADWFIRNVGRIHAASQLLGRNFAYSYAMANLIDQMGNTFGKAHGISGAELDSLKDQMAQKPSMQMIALSADESAKFVLDYPTWAYEKMMKFRDWADEKTTRPGTTVLNQLFNRTFDMIAPIKKIPLAGVETGLFRYSPLGLGRFAGRLALEKRGLNSNKPIDRTPIEQMLYARDTAQLWRQGAVGTALWTATGLLAHMGILALQGGDDDRQHVNNARTLLNEGYDPNLQVNVPFTDKSYRMPLKDLGVPGQSLALLDSIYQAQRTRRDPMTGEEESYWKTAERIMDSSADVLRQNPAASMVQGFSDLLSSQAKNENTTNRLGKFVITKATAFIPSLLSDVAQTATPNQVIVNKPGFMGELQKAAMEKIPGLRGKLQPKLNATGEPIPVEKNYMRAWPIHGVPKGDQADLLNYLKESGIGIPNMPKREPNEPATEYNARIKQQAAQLNPRLQELAESGIFKDDSGYSENERRGILSEALSSRNLARYQKMSPVSKLFEEKIGAVKGEALNQLVNEPDYASLSDYGQKKAKAAIDNQLKEFRARIGKTGETATAGYPWKSSNYITQQAILSAQKAMDERKKRLEPFEDEEEEQ